jgi:hypothetical protein
MLVADSLDNRLWFTFKTFLVDDLAGVLAGVLLVIF